MNFLMVFIGGGLGSMLRYAFGLGFQKTTLTLPWSTFVSNLTACAIFACVLWLMGKGSEGNTLRLLLLTGFCGGLSTFSSFGYETFLLLRQDMIFYAAMNMIANTALCLLIFYLLR